VSSLSRSTKIMFIFDLLTLIGVTNLTVDYTIGNSCSLVIKIITISLIAITGLFSLFLKGNYKIREFNINKKNAYLLFEGCVFAHIPALIIILFLASNIISSL